jgi:hypothetical protein
VRKRQLSRFVVAVILLLMICTGVAGERLAWPAEPDFSNVTDILSGQRHLLRDDDLLIVSSACRSFSQGCATSPAWLFTSNSQITSTQQVAFPVWGPPNDGSAPDSATNLAAAVGDFRGDGQRQIAVAINPPDFVGVTLTLYTVDPSSLTISRANAVTLPIPDASEVIIPALATGHFGTTLHDQLVLTYSSPGVGITSKVVAIDFDVDLQPTVKGTLDLKIANRNTPFVGSGRLNWFAPFDQAVVAVPGGRSRWWRSM